MKKMSLNELFTNLDLSAEELPILHSNDEVSYKNVQKRVIAKIENTEIIETNNEPKSNKKSRFILGFGIAAAVLAGGVGAISAATNVGRHIPDEEGYSAIDSSSLDAVSFSISEQENKADNEDETDNGFAYQEYPDFSLFKDVYSCNIDDKMDEADIRTVKYYSEGNKIWFLLHLKADLPESVSVEDMDISATVRTVIPYSHQYSSWSSIIEDESDNENVYMIFYCNELAINPLKHEYKLDIRGIRRKDAEMITEFGMKNIMGFTNAEINANKEFTPEMQQRINDEFVFDEDCGCYFHKEDIISKGSLSFSIDPSEDKFNIAIDDAQNDLIPLCRELFGGTYMMNNYPKIEDNADGFDVDICAMQKINDISEIIVRFVPQSGFTLEDCSFIEDTVVPYAYDSVTDTMNRIDDAVISADSYYDWDGDMMGGVPCFYRKYEVITEEVITESDGDLYVDINCQGGINPKTGKKVSEGSLQICADLGENYCLENFCEDTFTSKSADGSGNDVEIDITMSEWEITMKTEGSVIPEFLNGIDVKMQSIYETGFVTDKFTVITKDNLEVPIRMNVYTDKDGRCTIKGMLFPSTSFFDIDNIDSIEFDGKTIYEVK